MTNALALQHNKGANGRTPPKLSKHSHSHSHSHGCLYLKHLNERILWRFENTEIPFRPKLRSELRWGVHYPRPL